MAGEAAAALEAGEPVGSGSGNGGAAVDAKVRRYDRSTDPEAHSNPDLFVGEQGPADDYSITNNIIIIFMTI